MSKERWTEAASEAGSRRRFAVALGLAALILAALTLVGPAVSPSRAMDDIDGSAAGGVDSTPPEPDFVLTSHTIGKGSIKRGTTFICNGSLSAAETTVKDCSTGTFTGETLTLTATTAAAGYSFVGWSGACSGTGSCVIPIDGDKDVTARFMDDNAPASPAINTPSADGGLTQSTTGSITAKATSSDNTVDHISCSVDGTPVACTSGVNFTTPAKETGTYTLSVTATDRLGLVSSAATRSYKIVRKSVASVTGVPPAGSVTQARTTAVAISGDHNATVFECSLDAGAHWASCPVPLNAANLGVLENSGTGQLSEGTKALRVRSGIVFEGVTYFGDPTPTTSWTVDVTKPVTKVNSGPDTGDISNKRSVTFAFTQTDANPGTFQCALDSPTFGACPGGKAGEASYNLALGSHTFSVRSIDQAGNVESIPVTRAWKITADADGDSSNIPDDCDDANPAIHPGATEVLDNDVDENCDGVKGVNLDRDADGSNRPADCNDGNPSIRPGAVEIDDNDVDENCDGIKGVNPDRDGDGVQRPDDCDDSNPAIKPGAYDKPGDAIDQDCSGTPADYQRPGTSLSSSWAIAGGRTLFPVFKISGAPKGAKVTVSCKGKGCGFKSKKIKLKKGKADLRKLVKKGIPVGRGATIDVRTTVKDMLVSIIRVKVAKNGKAKTAKLCMRPGTKKTFACG
jgi:hypothetical protein